MFTLYMTNNSAWPDLMGMPDRPHSIAVLSLTETLLHRQAIIKCIKQRYYFILINV